MNKKEKYPEVLKIAESLVDREAGIIANMANLSALIHQTFGFWWTGFYLVRDMELVLGPFQGPVACTRIGYGKGVCGTAWKKQKTVIVPDVEEFPGHIACSSESKSEIVVPIWSENTIIAVLDIDSENLNTFDEADKTFLEAICRILSTSDIKVQ